MKQGSAEWKAMRRRGIGASDAPVIMGVSKWKTPYELWCEKMEITPEPDSSWQQRDGIRREEEARRAFEIETGHVVFADVVRHATVPYMFASLDGISIDRSVMVELKCAGAVDHEMAMDGMVPPHYMPQLQHQMECVGRSDMYYFSYGKNSQKCIKVRYDAEYVKSLLAAEAQFYHLMVTQTPPSNEDICVDKSEDIEWSNAAKQLISTMDEIDRLTEMETHLRQKLILSAGQSNAMGTGLKLSKILRKGSVEYGSIPQLKGIDLTQYRKPPTQSWRITRE